MRGNFRVAFEFGGNMYRFDEKKDKVREIQKYLFLTESGNYDEKTREGVICAQKRNGLEESGEIEYDTFRVIYREYLRKSNEDRMHVKFPDTTFPLSLGAYGEAIRETNIMLIALAKYYGIQTNLRNLNYYGERSERILEEMSAIYGCPRAVGTLDLELYMLLEKDFANIRRA